MREEHNGRQQAGDDNAIFARGPHESQANGSKTERQIVVHEAHVEDVAVGEHGDERGDEPGRIAAGGFGEGEGSPKENENTERDSDFFGGEETDGFSEIEKHEVEENVVPLPDDVDAWSSSLVDEFGEPGIVKVAAEIAGFDVRVPEARNHKEKRD